MKTGVLISLAAIFLFATPAWPDTDRSDAVAKFHWSVAGRAPAAVFAAPASEVGGQSAANAVSKINDLRKKGTSWLAIDIFIGFIADTNDFQAGQAPKTPEQNIEFYKTGDRFLVLSEFGKRIFGPVNLAKSALPLAEDGLEERVVHLENLHGELLDGAGNLVFFANPISLKDKESKTVFPGLAICNDVCTPQKMVELAEKYKTLVEIEPLGIQGGRTGQPKVPKPNAENSVDGDQPKTQPVRDVEITDTKTGKRDTQTWFIAASNTCDSRTFLSEPLELKGGTGHLLLPEGKKRACIFVAPSKTALSEGRVFCKSVRRDWNISLGVTELKNAILLCEEPKTRVKIKLVLKTVNGDVISEQSDGLQADTGLSEKLKILSDRKRPLKFMGNGLRVTTPWALVDTDLEQLKQLGDKDRFQISGYDVESEFDTATNEVQIIATRQFIIVDEEHDFRIILRYQGAEKSRTEFHCKPVMEFASANRHQNAIRFDPSPNTQDGGFYKSIVKDGKNYEIHHSENRRTTVDLGIESNCTSDGKRNVEITKQDLINRQVRYELDRPGRAFVALVSAHRERFDKVGLSDRAVSNLLPQAIGKLKEFAERSDEKYETFATAIAFHNLNEVKPAFFSDDKKRILEIKFDKKWISSVVAQIDDSLSAIQYSSNPMLFDQTFVRSVNRALKLTEDMNLRNMDIFLILIGENRGAINIEKSICALFKLKRDAEIVKNLKNRDKKFLYGSKSRIFVMSIASAQDVDIKGAGIDGKLGADCPMNAVWSGLGFQGYVLNVEKLSTKIGRNDALDAAFLRAKKHFDFRSR